MILEAEEEKYLQEITLAHVMLVSGRIPDDFISKYTDNDINTGSEVLDALLFSTLQLAIKYKEGTDFISALSAGKLQQLAPRNNLLISPFKALQSNLVHLVWQTHQIAKGDFSQKVNFMGDFSDSYNSMIQSLRDKNELELALQKSEKMLKELNATKDRFLSMISHDLKGSFNAILGFSELLSEDFDKFDDEKKLIFVNNIKNAAGSTVILFEELLEWSNSQMGTKTLYPENLNLRMIVSDYLGTLMPLSMRKNISLLNEIPADIIVYADKNALNTIVRNLVSNAIKFTFSGGFVKLDASLSDSFVFIRVIDNGIGFDNEVNDQAFNLDQIARTSGTADEKGTGLGLTLCKEFVERMGGKIHAERKKGYGSTFTFSVPLGKE